MTQLLLLALATLVSEDLTCIGAGVLVAQGRLGFIEATAACLLGILAGDLLLFLAGRCLGRPALRWAPLARLVPPAKVDEASRWLSEKGLAVVFISRFTPGLRLATYFASGLLRTRFRSFAFYFLLASLTWTPLLVGGTALLGGPFVERSGGAIAIVVALHLSLRYALSFPRRRRIVGFFKRKLRWEFWPVWAAYLPLIPYLILLALKHRSFTLFTLANPGIPSGGLTGESKSDILRPLAKAEGFVAPFDLIPASLPPPARIRKAEAFMKDRSFPVVLKPDVGERGSGVAIARSRTELESYLYRAAADTIIQQYIPGVEFGVFYYRFPHEVSGRIFSITRKDFPSVTGDGRSTIEQLILSDPRAVCLASRYLRSIRRPPNDVPAAGEKVPLVEVGSHCRGAVFHNGADLWTPALEQAVDCLSKHHPGFFFGRFDLRAASIEEFQAGRFQVIELNGVSAEAAHIYDPTVSLWEAYATLGAQWRIAFAIGAANSNAL
jgi:membrane protein DedA with SNARE-associated domain